jgi:hypothetical protein
MRFGFYDAEGVFFYDWDSSRPDEHYSYALAYGEESWAIRWNGEEIALPEKEYRRLLEAARKGNMALVEHMLTKHREEICHA